MRLQRLEIRSLPGIEPGFTFDRCSPGVNVITGPNASGKSSLARALGYLLRDAQKSDPPALSLEAEFTSNDSTWTVRRNGSQVAWTRNGEATSRPVLPGADQVGLYRLSMENLVADDKNDKALALELRKRLRGGYDLDEARIDLSSRFAQTEEKALRNAEGERRKIEAENADLQRQEATLPGLEREIEEAKAAADRRNHLQWALKLHEVIGERQSLDRASANFPPNTARVSGDELKRLGELEEKLEQHRETLRDQQRDLARAEAELDETGLGQARPAPGEQQAAGKQLQQVHIKSVQRENVQKLRDRAKSAMDTAMVGFGGGDQPPRLNTESFKRAVEIARPLLEAEAERRELEQQLKLAGEPPEQAEIDRLQSGADWLRRWLAIVDGNTVRPGAGSDRLYGRACRIVSWIALVGALAAGIAAWWQGAHLAWAAALVAAVAVGWMLFNQYRSQAAARRHFEDTGLAAPVEWRPDLVREYLSKRIEGPLYKLKLQQEQALRAKELRSRIESIEDKIAGLTNQKTALAGNIGFDPCLPSADFVNLVHLAVEWNKACTEYAAQRNGIERIDSEIADAKTHIRNFLDHWRAPDASPLNPQEAPDVNLLQSSFENLEERMQAAQTALADIGSCRKEITSLEQRITDVNNDIDALFTGAGFASRARAALVNLVEQLPGWKDLQTKLVVAENNEKECRARLEGHPELIKAVDEGRLAELQDELETVNARADEYTGLIEQRKEIQTRLNDAGLDHKLEHALAGEIQARDVLEDQRNKALEHAAVKVLLDDVEAAIQTEHEPALLHRARELFAQVTGHAFTLELRNDAFAARDQGQGTLKALGELSSGTRMQLLLALRLAWIEEQERDGEALPLFLDEALTTSDEKRFSVMAQSLERVAEDQGRQVFYLAARRHESALWKAATGAEPMLVDLAALRFGAGELTPDDFRVELPAALTAPGGRSAEDYAALLGVPRLDPRRSAEGIHLFYLLRDDLDLLHRLMNSWRVTRLGQIEALLASNAASAAAASAEDCRRLRRRCRAVRAWVELWRQGRGLPVDRAVLEQCDAVSQVFLDRAAELAKQVEGDGQALIRALVEGNLPRFHHAKAEELEQWLIGNSYIDERDRLTDTERQRLTLQQAAPETDADATDVNKLTTWLESAVSHCHLT